MATDEWGIDDGWWGNDGEWHEANPATIAALRELFDRVDPADETPAIPMWFVREGAEPQLDGAARVVREDGVDLGEFNRLPADLPLGFHQLVPTDGGTTTRLVIVADRIPPWADSWEWGVTAQVSSARTERSWGIGDTRDLAELGRWISERGGRVLGISPIGDAIPVTPRQNSPYSPSSRRHLDPLIIPLDPLDDDEREMAQQLNGLYEIDRDASFTAKIASLERHWCRVPLCDRPLIELGTESGAHAVFCAIAEQQGAGWVDWPAQLQNPGNAAVAAFAVEHADRASFFAWIQTVASDDFSALAGNLRSIGVSLLGDLPVGVAADGFDAWMDQEQLAIGWTIGAPPDPIGPHGQNWGLPPYQPHRLRANGYHSFLATLRANLARVSILRIDHVMGLFRLFWIPPGGDPVDGTYVRFADHELVDLVVTEAVRHGCRIIGEDLGTVEDDVRNTLAERGILGTKVAWFEKVPPERWPRASLGTLTTHDLPTVAGALNDTDPAADPVIVDRMYAFAERGETEDRAEHEEVSVAAHRRLGGAGSEVVLGTLEDLVGSHLRVNLPGTVDQYPNWRLPLPVGVDELDGHALAERISAAISEGRTARQSASLRS